MTMKRVFEGLRNDYEELGRIEKKLCVFLTHDITVRDLKHDITVRDLRHDIIVRDLRHNITVKKI